MGFIKLSISASLIVLVASVSIVFYQNKISFENIKRIEKWADNNKLTIDPIKTKIETFKIEFNQTEWNLLKLKLNLTRFFKPLNENHASSFEYGFNSDFSKELVQYWKEEFDWSKQIEKLNGFPQFKIKFEDDVTIHFARVVTNINKQIKSIPVLLLDGWPGSWFSFIKLVNYISDNYKDMSFDFILPSLPGYGYSTPLDKPVHFIDTARYIDSLMRLLHGDEVKYFAHGEDWGSVVVTGLAQLYPKRCKAIHLTMPISISSFFSSFYQIIGSFLPSIIYNTAEINVGLHERSSFKTFLDVLVKQTGYMHLQATKPDTLGHGLTDSPVGLMAYILEKYSTWTFNEVDALKKKDGGLNKFSKDDLLTIITYYWMSNCITSSVRFYKAYFSIYASDNPYYVELINAKVSDEVAVGIQYYMQEIFLFPLKVLKLRYQNITRYNIEENGGHFAAFENPLRTGKDLVEFIKSI